MVVCRKRRRPTGSHRSSRHGIPCRRRARPARQSVHLRHPSGAHPRRSTRHPTPSIHALGGRSNENAAGVPARHTTSGFCSSTRHGSGRARGLAALQNRFFPPPAAHLAARTIIPSMHHSASSILTWPRNRLRMACSGPSWFHVSNTSHTVAHGPKTSGKSRHGAPVLRIQSMPSRTCRRSRGGRPVCFDWERLPQSTSIAYP